MTARWSGLGSEPDALELLLNLRGRPALAYLGLGLFADQFVDGDVQSLGQEWQQACGEAHPAAFIVRHRLLGDAKRLGQLHLGDAECLAAFGNAATKPAVECILWPMGRTSQWLARLRTLPPNALAQTQVPA